MAACGIMHEAVVGRAVDAAAGVCSLPAVATLDWCDRAAEALGSAADRSVSTVMIAAVGEGLRTGTPDAIGAAATPGLRARSLDATLGHDIRQALATIRSRAYRLGGVEFLGGLPEGSGIVAGTLDKLRPEWRREAVGRVWAGVARGDVAVAAAWLCPAERRLLVAQVAMTEPEQSADEAAQVLAGVLPRLAARAQASIGPTASNPRCWLSPREQDVLELLVLGRSVKEIAAELGRSPHTVHDHVKALHKKLDASTRGGLIARALGLSDRRSRREGSEGEEGSIEAMEIKPL